MDLHIGYLTDRGSLEQLARGSIEAVSTSFLRQHSNFQI